MSEVQLEFPTIVKYKVDEFAMKPEAWMRIANSDSVEFIINRLVPGYTVRLLNQDNFKPFIMTLKSKHDDIHYLISSKEVFFKSLCRVFDTLSYDSYFDMKTVIETIKSRDDFKALFVLARSQVGYEYETLVVNEFSNV